MNRPLILVSNDDSHAAAGVHALIEMLLPFGDIVAVCPADPQSGQSMALTVNSPLRITRLDDYQGARMYKVNGTPVDCVKLSMHYILDRLPDLVVTGINHGSNSAINVLYSGTMGAAMEGCAFGVPSVGFSLTDHNPKANFSHCKIAVQTIVGQLLRHGLPDELCLNVNIPVTPEYPAEMRLAVPCRGKWNDEYKEYTDPHGGKFYWLTGTYINLEPENDRTDEWCLAHGMISVVPVAIERSSTPPATPDWLRDISRIYAENLRNN